jgi:hypothetical protein
MAASAIKPGPDPLDSIFAPSIGADRFYIREAVITLIYFFGVTFKVK